MLDLETIQILIAEALSFHKDVVISKGRRRDISDARSLFVYFSRKEGHALLDIAKFVSIQNRDAAQYHVDKIDGLVTRDKTVQAMYTKCTEKIKSYRKVVDNG